MLSEFTGAAKELRQAYLVNPHDIDGLKSTMVAAAEDSAARTRRGGCGSCAGTCSITTSTTGRGQFLDDLSKLGPGSDY